MFLFIPPHAELRGWIFDRAIALDGGDLPQLRIDELTSTCQL